MKAYTILKTDLFSNNGRDLVKIQVKGFTDSIWRTQRQFLAELKGSHIMPKGVNDFNHPRVGAILQSLVGGTVYGDLDWSAAGSTWEVTEDHPSVTDENHDKYGEYSVGDKIERETSGFHVDRSSMLSFTLSEAALARQENAFAMATANSFMDMFVSEVQGSTTKEDAPKEEEIPADVVDAFEEPEVEAKPAKKGKAAAATK